ncbi:hypothetical protein P3T35_005887 [Kitasatospora sp. GP30]|nr:hypothetical protein [Kitasatospora sp. GP30]
MGHHGDVPFTFSHPAAVLPLLRGLRGRGPLIASGLVAGSMAPDLPFFAASCRPGLFRHGALTHRWWAVPTVDVALAGAMVLGWRTALRRPLLGALPMPWAAAAMAATADRGEPPRAAAFALSAAIGAASHIGWDSFTHPGRAGVRLLPALTRPVAGVPLCTLAQYGGSALALAGLGRHLARELRALPPAEQLPPPAGGRRRRALLGASAALGAGHRVLRGRRLPGRTGLDDLVSDLCFGAGAGAVAGALVLSAVDRVGRGRYVPRAFD